MCAVFRDASLGRSSHMNGNGIRRFFEIGELAGQKRLSCIVPLARAQPLSKQIVSSFQVDELDVRIDLKKIAIAAFQRGTGEDDVLAERIPSQHSLANGIEPRDAVAIVEGDAARHFLNVGWRMKRVAVNETPPELGSKQL